MVLSDVVAPKASSTRGPPRALIVRAQAPFQMVHDAAVGHPPGDGPNRMPV